MDDIFKRKLALLRKPPVPQNFAEALFGEVDWDFPIAVNSTHNKISPENFSERKQVLESLERFAQEKITPLTEKVLKVPGGELVIKTDPTWSGVEKSQTLNELKIKSSIDGENFDLITQNKQLPLKVLFVAENFRPWAEVSVDIKTDLINCILPAFPLKTAEFFSKMIVAMKLTPEEFLIYPSEKEGTDLGKEVMEMASYFMPEVIITLGASATHKILKTQERLSLVHGQFFNREIENIGISTIVPLFHPSIIETNQNMKKTAWVDMQKIMRHIKKL